MTTKENQLWRACTSILVGKNASADGSVIIGRNEDSKPAWPKHFRQMAAPMPYTFTSKDTGFTIKLTEPGVRYTATPEWTAEYGVFAEDGINGYGVAMSATESAYANPRVLAYDPLNPKGIGEEAMITVVLPYIHSAREGVTRLGQIVSQYGTSESNGILFADQQEAWYLETGSGHHWVAQRIPDDAYAVVANELSIEAIDFADTDNFIVSDGIAQFAADHHLWRENTSFIFRDIFGTNNAADAVYNWPRVVAGQQLLTPSAGAQFGQTNLPFLRRPDRPIQIDDAMRVLANHYEQTPYDPATKSSDAHKYRPISLANTQESHLLQLRPNVDNSIAGIHWLAMGVAAESIYVPFYAGINDTPADYQQGALPYSADSAYWRYKLLGILADRDFGRHKKAIGDLQDTLLAKHLGLIAATDQQLAEAADVRTLVTTASNEAAQIAREATDQLIAELITEATKVSPLRFQVDPNL